MSETKIEKRAVQLNPARMTPAEFGRTVYVVTAEPETTKEDLLKPEYWAHVANKLRPWDRLEVRSDDGTFFAELLVLESSRVWARVHLLQHITLTSADVAQTQARNQDYEVRFRGPVLKWCAIRLSDAEPIKERMGSKEEAQAFLAAYRDKVGA